MRIAISGTHCSGKSTLVNDFLLKHPDFNHEPESYEVLQEEHGEIFAADPGAEDFIKLLEHCVTRVWRYGAADCVIHERSPVDYLAYLLALARLGREPDATRLFETSMRIALGSLANLDLIVFLSADDLDWEVDEAEDIELRTAVDVILESILIDDTLDWFSSNRPAVLQITGARDVRVRTLEDAI